MKFDFEVKIISLKARPERLEATVAELPKIGVTSYEWVEADPSGNLGCGISHEIALEGNGTVLVLEDDVVFEPKAIDVIGRAVSQLPEDWDLLYLGANVKEKAERYSDNLFRVRHGVHTTHAMLHSAKGRKLFSSLYSSAICDNSFVVIDNWLYHEGLGLMNCYVVWPMVAFQRPDYSDLRLAFQDYRKEMLANQKLNME